MFDYDVATLPRCHVTTPSYKNGQVGVGRPESALAGRSEQCGCSRIKRGCQETDGTSLVTVFILQTYDTG